MGQTAQPRADVWETCLDLADETGWRWWAGVVMGVGCWGALEGKSYGGDQLR